MFSQVHVKNSVHGAVSAPVQAGIHTSPWADTPPWADTSPDGHYSGQYTSTCNAFLFRFCLRLRFTTDIYESCVCDFVCSGYFSCYLGCELQYLTRMHSSRMHTICCGGRRIEGMYPSMHWVGGVSQYALGRGCVYSSMHWAGVGMSAQERGVCLKGCLPRRCCLGGLPDTPHEQNG